MMAQRLQPRLEVNERHTMQLVISWYTRSSVNHGMMSYPKTTSRACSKTDIRTELRRDL